MKPSVFKFLDYRQYLNSVFEYLKEKEPNFSFLGLSKKAGLSSPNLPQLILQNKRKLPEKSIIPLGKYLRLKKREMEYFKLLVLFGNSKLQKSRDTYMKAILAHPGYAVDNIISKSQYQYFEKWYLPVIRELVTSSSFKGNYLWIAQQIYPRISAAEVKRGIKILNKLDLIQWNEDQCIWETTQKVVKTTDEVTSIISSKYHRKMLELASESIEAFPPNQRDLRSVTLTVSVEKYQLLKQKMQNFWNELLNSAEEDKPPQEVIQIQLAMFPLTKKRNKD